MNQSHCVTNDSSADCIAVKRDDDNTRFIVAELLDLLNDSRSQQDTAVVTEIIKTVHLLVKEGGNRREEIIGHPQLLIFLSKFFNSDHHLTRLLASLFHDLSTNENGIRLLLATGVVPVLLHSLESSHDDVTNFLLTTLRNCLIGLPDAAAEEIQSQNGCMIFISLLLQRHSDRQMNFLADSLLRLGLFNSNAQIYLQTSKLFLQELVTILDETNYSKLSLTLIRMLPYLSSNINAKSMLIQFNLVPILERIFKTNHNYKIQRYCLLTLRNLSDQIIHMEHFDSLIVLLVQLLAAAKDTQIRMYIVDILSNLSCENQTNKSVLIHQNAIPLLVEVTLQSDHHDAMIESAICTLRHLTGKCLLGSQAREETHLAVLIPDLVKFLQTKEQNWSLLKACIGLIRNLALATRNLLILSEHRAVWKIGQLFLKMKSIGERHELFLSTLFVFSRQNNEKCRRIIQDELLQSGCLPVIVQCASATYPDRKRSIAQGILDDLAQSDSIEQAEKSGLISPCLH